MTEIINRLKDVISHLAMTPNAFATKANVDPSNFGKMLDGKQKITDKTIGKLCDAHKLSVDWIKTGVGAMMAPQIVKGNFDSPNGIYAEDSEVVIGDAVLRERIKHLQQELLDLRGKKKSWESERKTMQKQIDDLRSKNESLNSELSQTKDRMINLLMERGKLVKNSQI